ncbi:Dehydrogenase/reductase SDR family member 4 [Araneus ventricosus]|uniref:Dehydrogenase/reductase SDR family member 4 n=1 Tax=Araneus ventricosus TaxID=182803 RepID=A0A4Y2Q3G6_ARAVE|nr:Dehydrogenase/reductase SDR family member 4 [Araneus ventricosus]
MEQVETTRETFRKSCCYLCVPKRLGNDGWSVVLNIRKKENVVNDVSDLNSISDNASGIPCHVSKQEDRKLLLDFAVAKYGGIDILVSNAAANPAVCCDLDGNKKAWDKIFDTNEMQMSFSFVSSSCAFD